MAEFVYPVFTRKPGDSYRRRLRSLVDCVTSVKRYYSPLLVDCILSVIRELQLRCFVPRHCKCQRNFPTSLLLLLVCSICHAK